MEARRCDHRHSRAYQGGKLTKNKTWDDLVPSEFMELVKAGKSYTQIGIMFGVSRNSVSGKVLRWKQKNMLPQDLGHTTGHRSAGKLASRERAKPRASVPTVKPKPVLSFTPEVRAQRPAPAPKPEKIEIPDTPLLPGTEPVSIFKKRELECAVVVGRDDKGFPLYCGCRVSNLQFRMCEGHARYMLTTPQARQRDRRERMAIAAVAAAG